jgi:hypothetical protein
VRLHGPKVIWRDGGRIRDARLIDRNTGLRHDLTVLMLNAVIGSEDNDADSRARGDAVINGKWKILEIYEILLITRLWFH